MSEDTIIGNIIITILLILIILSLIIICLFVFYPSTFNSLKLNLEIKKVSLKDLSENKDYYLGKEVFVKGNISLCSNTCCRNLENSTEMYIESKITSPSSRYSIYLKTPTKLSLTTKNSEWECKGYFKKNIFKRYECETNDYLSFLYYDDNTKDCELNPNENCYYLDAYYCECISENC